MEERKRSEEREEMEKEKRKKDVSFFPAPLNRSPLANDDTIKETRVERFVWFE